MIISENPALRCTVYPVSGIIENLKLYFPKANLADSRGPVCQIYLYDLK